MNVGSFSSVAELQRRITGGWDRQAAVDALAMLGVRPIIAASKNKEHGDYSGMIFKNATRIPTIDHGRFYVYYHASVLDNMKVGMNSNPSRYSYLWGDLRHVVYRQIKPQNMQHSQRDFQLSFSSKDWVIIRNTLESIGGCKAVQGDSLLTVCSLELLVLSILDRFCDAKTPQLDRLQAAIHPIIFPTNTAYTHTALPVSIDPKVLELSKKLDLLLKVAPSMMGYLGEEDHIQSLQDRVYADIDAFFAEFRNLLPKQH